MACDLDGTDDFLTVPFSSDFEFPGDFAVSIKASFDSLSGLNKRGVLVLGRGANSSSGVNAVVAVWWLRIEATSLILCRFDGNNANYVEFARSFTWATSTLYTITATRTGTSLALYVNDTQQGSNFTTSLQFTQFSGGAPQDLTLGRVITGDSSGGTNVGGSNFAHYLNAQVSEVAIWKGAGLTAAEVKALSNGFTADQIRPQNLTFYAPLIRNLQDVRGGRVITNNGGATVATHPRIIT